MILVQYDKICMLLRAAHAALLRMREFVPRILQYWSGRSPS